MKNIANNSLITTALVILGISIIDFIWRINFIYTNTIPEVLVASFMIHGVRNLIRRLQCNYYLIETGLDFVTVLVLVYLCAYFFKWIQFTGPYILAGMVVIVYIIYTILDLSKAKLDVANINKFLQLKKELRTIDDEKRYI